MRKTSSVCVILVRRACRSCVSACLRVISCWARAIRSEVEKLIDTAVKDRQEAKSYLLSVVTDEDKAAQVLAFARRGRFSLDKKVGSNEERAEEDKPPLTDKGRRFLENKLKARREELLRIIGNEDEAE